MIFYTFINEKASSAEQHTAAHNLLSKVLKEQYKIEKYTLLRGDHGKPFLAEYPNIHFNLSHCTGLVICGISESEIGIDAELIRPYNGNAAKRIFTESELLLVRESANPDEMFFRLWTLKESLGKNLGTGISGMKNFEFAFDDDTPVCKAAPEKIFSQIILQKKWAVSVCADSREFDFVKY